MSDPEDEGVGREAVWLDVASGAIEGWDERNKILASHIPADSSVLDIGCGNQNLAKYLPEGCRYTGVDVVSHHGNQILDFEKGVYPSFSEQFDYSILSGVLEYLPDPADAVQIALNYGNAVIFSYIPEESLPAVRPDTGIAALLYRYPRLSARDLERALDRLNIGVHFYRKIDVQRLYIAWRKQADSTSPAVVARALSGAAASAPAEPNRPAKGVSLRRLSGKEPPANPATSLRGSLRRGPASGGQRPSPSARPRRPKR